MDEFAESWKEIGKKNIESQKSRLEYWIQSYLFYNSIIGIFAGIIFVLVVEFIASYGLIKFVSSYSLMVIGVGLVFVWYFKRSMQKINEMIDEMTNEKEIIANGKRLSGKNPEE